MADEPLRKVALWKWNKAKHEAAQLLAADELTDQEIADKVGVQRNTLWHWKKRPEFMARVKEATELLGDVALRYEIGRRARRVAAQNDRWQRMNRIIEERAAAREMEVAAGGTTGLLCHTQKSIGAGPNAEKVDEYTFDAALMKELREHEKQAAQELGQLVEKWAPVNPDGTEPYQSLSDEQIVLRILGLIGPAALGGALPETAGGEAGGTEEAGAE